MDLIVIVGILGSIASIYGAYLSIEAKKESEKSAKKAEFAKDIIIRKQKTTNLGSILFEAKRVQHVFGKYSIAESNKSLVGVKFNEDSQNLQDFIFNFNESRAMIEETTDIETQTTYSELNNLLATFCGARGSGKINSGKQIRMNIDIIIHKIKRSIDSRNEKIE